MSDFAKAIVGLLLVALALYLSPVSAEAFRPHGFGGGVAGGGGSYSGPCDVITGGCAEAYSVTRAMTSAYSGPLFQIYNGTTTLDIVQTSGRAANMTTWSAFCGSALTAWFLPQYEYSPNCYVTKIYAQVHTTANDLQDTNNFCTPIPGCSAPFSIDTLTGLPILITNLVGVYTIGGDDAALTGIPGGTANSVSEMYEGLPQQTTYCCGQFGLTHATSAPDTLGTDFMVALGYWQRGLGFIQCNSATDYCAGSEDETSNDLWDYSATGGDAVVAIAYNHVANSITAWVNNDTLGTNSPPCFQGGCSPFNPGNFLHVGGGGDLGRENTWMRDGLITNTVMSSGDVSAAFGNTAAFYGSLTFAPVVSPYPIPSP
jgi:hypothetical protein